MESITSKAERRCLCMIRNPAHLLPGWSMCLLIFMVVVLYLRHHSSWRKLILYDMQCPEIKPVTAVSSLHCYQESANLSELDNVFGKQISCFSEKHHVLSVKRMDNAIPCFACSALFNSLSLQKSPCWKKWTEMWMIWLYLPEVHNCTYVSRNLFSR